MSDQLEPKFEQYQSGSLHEAGHAVVAVALGRKLVELSILRDQHGNGYVFRERRESTAEEIVEEIAIALAGEETPFLWGTSWVTDAQHDYARIEELANEAPFTVDDHLVNRIRECVQVALQQFREAIGDLAWVLSDRKSMSGKNAEDIIAVKLSPQADLRECLARVLSAP